MTDLFPGFARVSLPTSGGTLIARAGGPDKAPPLLLLHGYPQSHLCWHPIATDLAEDFRVIALDLKGYGDSAAPAGDGGRHAYAKRTLAAECVQFMAQLGHDRFTVAGHDRGAQVAYQMALATPRHVERLAVLDNLPVHTVWEMIEATPGALPHWTEMARPSPQAEAGLDVEGIEDLVRKHTADGTLDCFSPAALEQYRQTWRQPERIHAFCEDYRAGATTDREADHEYLASGRAVTCPTTIIWGATFLGAGTESPLSAWRRTFTPDAVGVEVPGGHFVVEESPKETLAALRDLMTR
ncbi:alpha/beta fold hydrolase [Amycolatopsis sp. GM8]|uniref:alpha/beta fold hydrolase n=1 Tax=Amycolatopsis sp. GM8 TaxID=2896530 RepID=UPI001F46D0D0|nr:alpha/beta hydrolase [Amycolatopsis sp. GM8]